MQPVLLEPNGLHRRVKNEKKDVRDMFAVIKTGGKQYTVAADDLLKVEKLDAEAGSTVTFEDVLMVGNGTDTTVGAPTVEGASVVAEVVDQGRGRKIIIFKKRRRQNSRRRNGHRQSYTLVKVTDILTGGAKPAKKAAPKKAAPKADEPKAEAAPKAEEAKADVKEAKKEEAAVEPLFTAPEGKDDLKKISGVGPVLEKKLNALGITTYEQIVNFSAEDIARVDEVLNFKGRIERDNWVEQAKELAGN
ncbi:50S ribosomal protein L21 [Roseibium album]|uniref:Large ribosomal subunit protein bL21 n=2 Tax=Roseibium album TaxID=311410 RepID=A0A0M7AZC9_9HYPH|nr:50S ribosomal protein L21 [Roseibium album]CTQ68516.1 50S ribosomal protein L21 [Roseibium album]CTQ79580.1 50S ribosomal protein L21 [Roseibium album]